MKRRAMPAGQAVYERQISALVRSGQRNVFWGRRSYVSVRIPLKNLAHQPPPWSDEKLGKLSGFVGCWERRTGKKLVVTSINSVSSSRLPTSRAVLPRLICEGVWSWYEGDVRTFRGTLKRENLVSVKPLPVRVVKAFAERQEWEKRYTGFYDSGDERFVPFCEPANYAKTSYVAIKGKGTKRYLLLTYSVKPMSPDRVDDFCCTLARALLKSEQNGLGAKLVVPRPRKKTSR